LVVSFKQYVPNLIPVLRVVVTHGWGFVLKLPGSPDHCPHGLYLA
jgi:hypothetical protein